MQQKNLIVPILDFAGPKAIQAGKYLSDHSDDLSILSVQRRQYLTPTATLKRFYENVATLPLNSSSSFIRSRRPRISAALFNPTPARFATSWMQSSKTGQSFDVLQFSH
jgi:hypothetical protein